MCKGDVGLFDFQVFTKGGPLLRGNAVLGFVTHNSSKCMSLRTKRLGWERWYTTLCLLEEADVVKRAKR